MDLQLITNIAISIIVIVVASLLLKFFFKIFGKLAKAVLVIAIIAAILWLLFAPNGALQAIGVMQSTPFPCTL